MHKRCWADQPMNAMHHNQNQLALLRIFVQMDQVYFQFRLIQEMRRDHHWLVEVAADLQVHHFHQLRF